MNELSASLPQERLVETVDMWWPRLDAKLRSIKERPQLAQAAVPQRSPEDMLAELLELTRGLQRGLQTTREVRHPPVMTPSTLYLKELALERFAEIARTHGFQVTFLESSYALNLSNTSSVDLELERAGRKLYVKTTGDINLSQAHEVLRQVRSIGIQDPLILLTLVSVHPDTISQIETELGEHIRVVPRESRLDTFKTALGQLSQS